MKTYNIIILLFSLYWCKSQGCGNSRVTLTQSEKDELLDAHNYFRAGEPAADMLAMTWSEELAIRSQDWGNTCSWKHGMMETCDGTKMGQNLWFQSFSEGYPEMNLTKAVEDWWIEILDYHFDSQYCSGVCGHYTQIVWSRTSQVGCAWKQCPRLSNGAQNANYLICDYMIPGNMMGEPLYTKGAPCSKCGDVVEKGYICKNNMCHECTPNTVSGCKCETKKCSNGGQWDNGNCACKCPSGFYGTLCEKSCECTDANEYCNQWTQNCGDPYYEAFMKENCDKTCNTCTKPRECNV